MVLFLFILRIHNVNSQEWSWEQVDSECDITAIWGSAKDDIYVGGGQGLSGCCYHYDGASWDPLSLTPFVPIIFGIWGSASTDVYIVGLGGQFHYDGSSWNRFSSAVGEGVWGTSVDNIFISHKDILLFDGFSWIPMTLPTSSVSPQIRSVWGFDDDRVYAVGSHGTILYYDGNASLEWVFINNGIEETSYDLYDIWGSAPDDLFAVGAVSTILHYDGTSWSEMDAGISYYDWIHNIWGTSSSDVYACTFEHGDILHYDGMEWSIINTGLTVPLANSMSYGSINSAGSAGDDVKFKAIWGSGSGDIYFAGENGIVLHYQTGPTIVDLDLFYALPFSRAVMIEWSTQSEIDNAGFNIYRSYEKKGSYEQINERIIPARGSATNGASYKFTDQNVRNSKTYWYKLEDVDFRGARTMHGPVSSTPRLLYGMEK